MAELVYAVDLKSAPARVTSSNLVPGTILRRIL